MRILLTGGTGFVGTALNEALKSQGHETVLLTRHDVPPPGVALAPHWLAGVDAIVNMAGESIAQRFVGFRFRHYLIARALEFAKNFYLLT